MQLSRSTDYAIRIVYYLAIKGSVLTSTEISHAVGVQHKYFPTISKKLRKAGIIASIQGSKGGFFLSKPKDQITLWDIVSTMERTMKVHQCLEEGTVYSRKVNTYSSIRSFYIKLQNQIDTMLLDCKISDLLEDKNQDINITKNVGK